MPDLNDPKQRAEFRLAVKEAIDEWLEKQFAAFGRWSAAGIASLIIGFIAYIYFNVPHGFKP